MNKYSGALARRYGTALFELLIDASKDEKDFENYVHQIELISKFCTKKVIHYFILPSLTNEEISKILDTFLNSIFSNEKYSEIISSFLKTILLNKRFTEINQIFEFFLKKSDDYLNIARACLVTARVIQENDIKDFENTLSQCLNQKIVFQNEVDESLKSGFIVKLGNLNIDASLKSRLINLKELFI